MNHLIDTDAASELLDVPTTWLTKQVKALAIPHIALPGDLVRFDPVELEAWWKGLAEGKTQDARDLATGAAVAKTRGKVETTVSMAFRPVALSKPHAAAALDVSVDSFERYVMPEVRCVRRGRLRLFPVAELERWADENATATLETKR